MPKTEIIDKEGNKYFYNINSYNAENALGVIKATLKEYSLYKLSEPEIFIGKLYKTKEGNWYDLPGNNKINTLLASYIKKAIDESEKLKQI